MTLSPFFTLHSELPREGPGDADAPLWAARRGQVRNGARIADIACGPGADIGALLNAVPGSTVTGIDRQAHFVAAARARYAGNRRVEIHQGDMAEPGGPYDFIWCAGALYFLGVEAGLRQWREALAPEGVVAFSEPVWFTDDRPQAAQDMWADYPAMTDRKGILAQVTAAGYRALGTRPVSDAGWEAYYGPKEARIAKLRAEDPGAELARILDQSETEIACWRAHRDICGYLMVVARKMP